MNGNIPDQGEWESCTATGARISTLLLGLETTFREKLEWLEDAETLSLKFDANRARAIAEGRLAPPAPANISNRDIQDKKLR